MGNLCGKPVPVSAVVVNQPGTLPSKGDQQPQPQHFSGGAAHVKRDSPLPLAMSEIHVEGEAIKAAQASEHDLSAPAPTPTAQVARPTPAPAAARPSATGAAPVASKLRTDCKVKDAYKIGKTLGTGGFAVVKLATDRQTHQHYAVKIMALPEMGFEPGDNENTREDIFKEIDILCGLCHENVVYLKEYFEEGNKVFLITELVTGGELLEAVLARGTYSEAEARSCFMQLLKGIQYLHSKNVVHRDLKLENLLLATPEDITRVKIADFGLAKRNVEAMSTVCGTPQYVAPEVIMGTPGLIYGPEVDMWSAGVVLFILLGGYPPFWSDSEPALFEQIRKGSYNFDDAVWDMVSSSAKELIRKLLVVDPRQRLSATEALSHPWMTVGEVSAAPLLGALQNMKGQVANLSAGNMNCGLDASNISGCGIDCSAETNTCP